MPRLPHTHYAVLLTVSAAAIFFHLGTPRLWDRDEPRNAGCAAEMLARGDWVVPVFNDELRSAKPVLLYWLIMGGYALCGANEWGARLPSALLAVGTVLTTYHLGRRLFSPTAGLWGGLALSTSLLFDASARAATPDSALVFFSTLGLALFARGVFPDRELESLAPPRKLTWQMALALYAALALAVLTKGPVGIVLPVSVMALFLSIARLPRQESILGSQPTRLRETCQLSIGEYKPDAQAKGVLSLSSLALQACFNLFRPFTPLNLWGTAWSLRPWLGVAMLLVVAAPWYVLVALRTDGEWLQRFLWDDNVQRVVQTLEAHRGSLVYYPASILAGLFPWSVFALPVAMETTVRLIRRDARAAGYLFCVCWVSVYVGLFTLARTKLPSYVAPCYPALALLAGVFVERWLAGSLAIARWWPVVSLGVLGGAAAVLLVVLAWVAGRLFPGDAWLGGVALIPLCGAIAALAFTLQGRPRRAAICFALMATATQAGFFGVVMVRVDRHQQSQVLFDALRSRGGAPQLASFGCLESSWVVYAGRPIMEFRLDGLPVRSAASFSFAGDTAGSPAARDLVEFATRNEAYVITTQRSLLYLQPHLPPDMRVLAEVPYFLEQDKLLLLGREQAGLANFSAGL